MFVFTAEWQLSRSMNSSAKFSAPVEIGLKARRTRQSAVGSAMLAVVVTVGTFWLFVWLYPTAQGRPFALGMGALLLAHECGHIAAAKCFGLRPSGPVFVPYFGAFVSVDHAPDPWIDAIVSLSGPVAGVIGASVCGVVYLCEHEPVFRLLCNAGFLFNVFNLLPVPPLDGRSVVKVAFPSSRWRIAAALAVLMIVGTHRSVPKHPLEGIGLIVLYACSGPLALAVRDRVRSRRSDGRQPPTDRPCSYVLPSRQRRLLAMSYVGLVVFSAVGLWLSETART